MRKYSLLFLFAFPAYGQEPRMFGGRILYDASFYSQDDTLEKIFGELGNGMEFRAIRFFNSGQISGNVHYKAEVDFAGGKITPKDVYLELEGLGPLGRLRAGHFKEPFRLEALTSSRFITFMERSLPVAFLPERNIGAMLYNDVWHSRLSWAAGLFRRADNSGNDAEAGKGYGITGRLTGLPVAGKERDTLLHIGASFSYIVPDDETYTVKSKPETHLGKYYLNTGAVPAKALSLAGAEAALVLGPFSLQGEWIQTFLDTNLSNTAYNFRFQGYYVYAGYFITGEHRPFISSYNGFGRISPRKNFKGKEGAGAWELTFRYSSLDLNSEMVSGGRMDDITAGLNWYLNPHTRAMFNYVLANVSGTGNATLYQLRLQVDF